MKNGVPIKDNASAEAFFGNDSATLAPDDSHYDITSSAWPPSEADNRLLSVESVLEMELSAWPGGGLDPERDAANYSCVAGPNVIGPGVESVTRFRVHFPPRNISVSPK